MWRSEDRSSTTKVRGWVSTETRGLYSTSTGGGKEVARASKTMLQGEVCLYTEEGYGFCLGCVLGELWTEGKEVSGFKEYR